MLEIGTAPITLGLDSAMDFGLLQDNRCYTAGGVKDSMTPHPYQNAYDTAIGELSEITTRFEQLRERKNQVENLIHVLEPFFAATEEVGGEKLEAQPVISKEFSAESPASDAPPEGYSFRDVPSPLPDLAESGGDPFQRRVKASFRFRGLATQRSF